jgi:WD40 repeat protein
MVTGASWVLRDQDGHELARNRDDPKATYEPAAVAFSPKGDKLLLAGDEPGDVVLVDAGRGKAERTYPKLHPDRVRALAWLPDGKGFLSGGSNSGVRLVGPGEKPAVTTLQEKGMIRAIATDGERVAWLNWLTQGATFWRLGHGKTGGVTRTSPYVMAVAMLPGGKVLAGEDSGRLLLWDVARGTEITTQTAAVLKAVAFSPSGDRIAAGGTFGCLRSWGAEDWEPRDHEVKGHLESVCFSRDGHSLAAGGADGLQVIDLDTGAKPRDLPTPARWVRAVVPEGDLILAAGGPQTNARPAECEIGRVGLDARPGKGFAGHADYVTCLALSGDGRRLLSGGNPAPKQGAAATPNLCLWDVKGGLLGSWRLEYQALGVGLSRDGKRAFCTGTHSALDCYATETPGGNRVWSRPLGAASYALLVTPNDRVIVAGALGQVDVFTLKGDHVGQWQLPGLVRGLALAPDGRHLATVNYNGTVYVLRLPAPPPRPTKGP